MAAALPGCGHAAGMAERFRAARERFELALELGCTPAEAQTVIDRRRARERWEEVDRRLTARRSTPPTAPSTPATADAPTRPLWWLNN